MIDDLELCIPCPPGVPPHLWHRALDVADATIAEMFDRASQEKP